MRTKTKLTYLGFTISVLLSTSVIPAYGQESVATEADEVEIEVINVTAQRRVQSIQEVPVSVTALGTRDLEVRQVNSVLDLNNQIPNISLATNTASSPGCNGVVSIQCALDLELKNAPEYKATLGITHLAELANGVITSRIDITVEDDSWNLVANAPESALTSVGTLINARVAYEPTEMKWQIAAWARNLADHEYSRASAAGSFSQYASDPLMWGVDVEYRF